MEAWDRALIGKEAISPLDQLSYELRKTRKAGKQIQTSHDVD